MIEPLFENLLLQHASKHVKSAIVTINGTEYEFPITKTVVRDGFFKHYVEIEDEPSGTIEKAVAVDEYKRPLMTQEPMFNKGDDGWQIAFKVKVSVLEGGE